MNPEQLEGGGLHICVFQTYKRVKMKRFSVWDFFLYTWPQSDLQRVLCANGLNCYSHITCIFSPYMSVLAPSVLRVQGFAQLQILSSGTFDLEGHNAGQCPQSHNAGGGSYAQTNASFFFPPVNYARARDGEDNPSSVCKTDVTHDHVAPLAPASRGFWASPTPPTHPPTRAKAPSCPFPGRRN